MMPHIVKSFEDAIAAIDTLETLGAQSRALREREIVHQDHLNKAANYLADQLRIENGHNKVIVHNGVVYNLDRSSHGASLIRIESVTV